MSLSEKDYQDRAETLRAQSLANLMEAESYDHKKPYLILHEHKYGRTPYVGWFDHIPTTEEASALLESEYEPEIGENLDILVLTAKEFLLSSGQDLKDEDASEPAP